MIELVDHNASDLKVANAARVSFGKHSDELTPKDIGLINFLVRQRHGTPFEHSTFTFRVQAPIAVIRDWFRHRAGHSYNEMSGRYVTLERKFCYPAPRVQGGKPGQYSFKPWTSYRAKLVKPALWIAYNTSYAIYAGLTKLGLAKEAARYCLPVATYSEFYWTCNARSLMHWLGLRNAPDAMKELQEIAAQAEAIFQTIMPATHAAFLKNERRSP
jgi:thymidylate synthase (FAD)